MLSGKDGHWWILLLSLLIAAVANGTPTVSSDNNKDLVVHASSASSDTNPLCLFKTNLISESRNYYLSGVSAEFLKPPAGFKGSVASPPARIKSLPAVPATLFMVLTGFLCVSLVKDRRLWLAMLVGLLWAGHTGIQALPRLATHLSDKKHHIQRKSTVNNICLHQLENYGRLRSEIEGTRYIGLLHHLAGIPNNIRALLLSTYSVSSLRPQLSGLNTLPGCRISAQTKNRLRLPQFAITSLLSCLTQPTNWLVSAAEQVICFSPAFVFQSIPRAPPLHA